MTQKKKISCGIIGVGWWGMQMCEYILKSQKFLIVTVYDSLTISAEKASKKFCCSISSSIEDLVQTPNIKCVFIFSPNHFHVLHAVTAARSKKHIFLEKPIANTSKEGEEIFKVCKENNVVLAIGHNVRHYSIFQETKKAIDKNLIGEIIYVECNRSRPIGWNINKNNWRFYKDSCNGGPLIQMAIHLVDTLRFMIGFEFKEIYTIPMRRFLKTENHESFSVSIILKSNIILHLFTSYMLPESFYINIFGTEGVLFADPFNGLYYQKKGSLKKRKISYKKNQPEIEEILEFYNAVTKQKNFVNPKPEESIENVRIIEKIQEKSIR